MLNIVDKIGDDLEGHSSNHRSNNEPNSEKKFDFNKFN